MIEETDKRNQVEETNYDFTGRAISAIGKDGSYKQVSAVQNEGVYPSQQTTDITNTPDASQFGAPITNYADENGNVRQALLDTAGQRVSATDGEGFLPSVQRDENNLVTQKTDARGNRTEYIYDNRGNVIQITEEIKSSSSNPVTSLTFNSLPEFTVGFAPTIGELADFNRDGTLDLVVQKTDNNSISIWLGNNNGSFIEADEYGIGINQSSLSTGDVNKDGNLDLVVGNNNFDTDEAQISLLLGVGDGTFNSSENYSLTSDFGIINSVKLEDLDNDGNLDIITAWQGGGYGGEEFISVLLGDENGSFESQSDYSMGFGVNPVDIAVGDVNEDGNLDVVTVNQNYDSVSVLIGDGSGYFSSQNDITVGSSPRAITLEDINGDDNLDIIVANYFDSNVSVLLGDGNREFNFLDSFSVSGVETMALEDMNGDGFSDIVTVYPFTDKISIFRTYA